MRKKDDSIKVLGIPKGEVENECKSYLQTSKPGTEILATGSGHLPDWAGEHGMRLWQASDSLERKNGSACRAIGLRLPDGLDVEQGRRLVQQFVTEEVGPKPHAFVLYAKKDNATPDKAVVFVSDRVQDGIYRDEEHFFRRYRNALPAWSGCRKDGQGKVRGDLSNPELTRLQNWQRMRDQAIASVIESSPIQTQRGCDSLVIASRVKNSRSKT